MLYALILILMLLLVYTGAKLLLIKRSLKELRQDLTMIMEEPGNLKLRLSGRDKDLLALARDLDEELLKLRTLQLEASYVQKGFQQELSAFFHDLKTPLSAAIGYLDLALEEQDPQLQKQYMSKARERLDFIRKMSRQFLDASIALDKSLLNQDHICLNQALEEALLNFYTEIPEKMEVEVSLCPEPVYRNLHKESLIRILENLISNAIRHGAGWIRVALDETGRITIENPAPDLDLLDVEQMFERYFTVEKMQPSSGLGLSIARTLSRQLQADLKASLKDQVLQMQLFFPESDRNPS